MRPETFGYLEYTLLFNRFRSVCSYAHQAGVYLNKIQYKNGFYLKELYSN